MPPRRHRCAPDRYEGHGLSVYDVDKLINPQGTGHF